MRTLLAAATSLAVVCLAGATGGQAIAASAYDFEFQSIDGQPMKLADWRGKALLVVNTASFCGYTRQYGALQQIWKKYAAAGLVVVGVPSNDFGDQEPEGESAIKTFCEGAFGVTFPMTSKQIVTGPNAHPFYRWIAAEPGSEGEPAWNFHKYLIGRDGRFMRAFTSAQAPTSDEITGWIEKALGEDVPGPDAIQN